MIVFQPLNGLSPTVDGIEEWNNRNKVYTCWGLPGLIRETRRPQPAVQC